MFLKRLSAATLLLSCFHVGLAQTSLVTPVKSGDKLSFEILNYDMRGQELYIASTTPITAEILVSADGHIRTYSSGRIEKFDGEHTLVEVTTGQRVQKIPAEWLFKWMPDGKDFTSSRKLKQTGRSGSACANGGTFVNEFDVLPKKVTYKVTLSGKESEIHATEFEMIGRWTAAGCGTGKQTQKIVYSPDLNIVLETETLNYLPNGLFLNRGSAMRLKSIN